MIAASAHTRERLGHILSRTKWGSAAYRIRTNEIKFGKPGFAVLEHKANQITSPLFSQVLFPEFFLFIQRDTKDNDQCVGEPGPTKITHAVHPQASTFRNLTVID